MNKSERSKSDDERDTLSCADWQLQIKLAERRNERWENRCKKIIKRYRNEHFDQDNERASSTKHGMNVLWSNVETLRPSVYGQEPLPIAERRFLDKDIVGRTASQILERAMRYEMADCGFHDTAMQGVKDYLLVGRGVAWLRFKPVIGPASSLTDRGDDDLKDQTYSGNSGDDPSVEQEDRDGELPTEETPQEKLLSAGVEVDYVHWNDFLTSKARFWKEVEWVCRKLYLSRDDLVAEYGEEIGKAVPLEMSPEQDELKAAGPKIDTTDESMRKAIVYEIWHKPTRKVYTIAKEFDKYLEEPREDPLNLEGFWPCPKPLFATMTNDTLEPVPDYLEYQDQALQIDEITNRISMLTKALAVKGVYDASNKNLARLLDEGNENKMIPVQNWAQLSEKGGLAQAVSFVPLKEVADTLMGLTQARDKVKQDMFEVTGLADVIRGQNDPRETAEAVKTKGRWGSLRLQARQMAVAEWCRAIIRMMGEIIAEHYPAELLVTVSGAMYDEGIGGEKPEQPDSTSQPPAPNPMLGHNGGPPMAGGGGVGPLSAGAGSPAKVGIPHPAGIPSGGIGSPPSAGIFGGNPSHAMARPISLPPASIVPHPVGAVGPSTVPGGGFGIGGPVGHGPQPGLSGAPAPGMAPAGPVAPPPIPPEVLYQIALAKYQADKQALIMKAIGLLKQEKMRGFRIDIETDSTVQNEAGEDKAQRIEFIEAVTKFIEQGAQIGMQQPDAVPMLGKMLLFGVRGFRAGRDLESTIEEFVDKMEKDAAKAKDMPKPPSPEVQKGQLELQAVQAKSQAEVQKAQLDAQASDDDNKRAIAQKQMDAQLDQQRAQLEIEKMRQELAFKQAEFEMKMQEMRASVEMTAREHASKMALAEKDHAHKREQMDASHQNALALIRAKPKKAEKAA